MKISNQKELCQTLVDFNSDKYVDQVRLVTEKVSELGGKPYDLQLSGASESIYVQYEIEVEDELFTLKVRFSNHTQRSGDCDICVYAYPSINAVCDQIEQMFEEWKEDYL